MNLQVQFLKDMCSDPFMKIPAQYTDTTGGIGSCTVYTHIENPWIDTNPFPHNPVLNVDLQAEAAKMLVRTGLPASLDTEVFIFTPYGTDSCFDTPGGFCFSNSFCAYHSGFGTTNYANMPDVASFGDCGSSPSPNNDPIADLEINPLSHELMESLTDPSGSGWMFNMMFDHEIADQCAYDDFVRVNPDNSDVHLGINGNPYFIQTEWSNSNGGCALTEQSLPLPPSEPPSGIQSTALSSSSILVSWTTSSGATSYNVFHSISPTGPFTTLVGTSSVTSLTDTGLSPSTQYYYKITASNIGGTSAISNTSSSTSTLLPTGTITGTVYNDANGNGVQNVGELGVPGITIGVFSYATQSSLTPVTTNSAGQYTFNNVPAGGVAVIETIPAGTINTQPGTIPSTTISGVYYSGVTAGNTATFNFGNAPASAVVLPTGTITGTVYNDANGNGVQNVGELGVPGITIGVFSYATQSSLTPVTTNSAGQYTFNNVPAGGVAVIETIPAGTINTQPGTIPSTTISGVYYSGVTAGNTA